MNNITYIRGGRLNNNNVMKLSEYKDYRTYRFC